VEHGAHSGGDAGRGHLGFGMARYGEVRPGLARYGAHGGGDAERGHLRSGGVWPGLVRSGRVWQGMEPTAAETPGVGI